MLLHLFNKNRYVILEPFEKVFPNRNLYLAFDNVTPMTSKSELNEKYKIEIVTNKNMDKIIKSIDFSDIDTVIIHYMTYLKIKFIKAIPKSVKICWLSYGGDLYNEFLFYEGYDLYYENPFKTLYKNKPIKRIFMPLFLKIRAKINFRYLIKRINSFSGASYIDALIFEKYAKKAVDKKEIYFLNSRSEDRYKAALGTDFDKFASGTSVMIGHSASMTNNHLYAIKFLKDIDLRDSKIYISLSYSGCAEYKKNVIYEFKEIFKNKGIVNDKFVSIDEYYKYLLNFNTFIFANWRQEALGNIFFGFFYGIKIFLSNKNPLFRYFKDQGFIVYELEKLNQDLFDQDLSYKEKSHNRDLVSTIYSFDRLLTLIKDNFS